MSVVLFLWFGPSGIFPFLISMFIDDVIVQNLIRQLFLGDTVSFLVP